MARYKGESEYLGAWSYAFLSVLYAIPIIGLIVLLIHSYSDSNENLRHFARSYFTRLLLFVIIAAVFFTAQYFILGPSEFSYRFNNLGLSISYFFDSLRIF